jgi:hypothetical protein
MTVVGEEKMLTTRINTYENVDMVEELVTKLKAYQFETDVELVIEQMVGPIGVIGDIAVAAGSRMVPWECITVDAFFEECVGEIEQDLVKIKTDFPSIKRYVYAPYHIAFYAMTHPLTSESGVNPMIRYGKEVLPKPTTKEHV